MVDPFFGIRVPLFGIRVDRKRVPLIGPQGIFKPRVLPDMPISIATAPVREGEPRPYDDGLDEQGLLSYRYRGTDPRHRDNVGLRLAMQRRVPLCAAYTRPPSARVCSTRIVRRVQSAGCVTVSSSKPRTSFPIGTAALSRGCREVEGCFWFTIAPFGDRGIFTAVCAPPYFALTSSLMLSGTGEQPTRTSPSSPTAMPVVPAIR